MRIVRQNGAHSHHDAPVTGAAAAGHGSGPVSPVTHLDAPVQAAILPSIVMAYFMETKGRPVVI